MRKRIFLIIPSLSFGGAEKFMASLAKSFNAEKNYDVLLICCSSSKKESQIEVPKDLDILHLDKKKTLYSAWSLYKLIHRKKPDVVISTIINLNILLAFIKFFSRSIHTKFIARETLIPRHEYTEGIRRGLVQVLCRLAYPLLDTIVFQSRFMREDFFHFIGDLENTIVINNMIDEEQLEPKEVVLQKREKIKLIFVGRLSPVKQLEELLLVLSHLDSSFTLDIIGEGACRSSVEELSNKLGLKNRIRLLGFKRDPYKYMNEADALVMTSKYEGFPNVMLESLALSKPVFTYNSPGGIAEIVENVYGENSAKFVSQMNNSKELSDKISSYFVSEPISDLRRNTLKSFSSTNIIEQYKKLID